MAGHDGTTRPRMRMLVRIPDLTPDQLLRLLRREACVRIYEVPFALAGVRADGLLTVEPWEAATD